MKVQRSKDRLPRRATSSPADSKVALNYSFFFSLPDLFGLQSVVMDGARTRGVLWASAALKCMGMGLKRWDEWSRQRDEMEGPAKIYGKKATAW